MSRYYLNPKYDKYKGYCIFVGWDGALGNFFGEVLRPVNGKLDVDAEVVARVAEAKFSDREPSGGDFNAVISMIGEYANIDSALREKLWDDCRKEGVRRLHPGYR